MSTSRYMVEGIAYELWAQALAGYCHDHPTDTRRSDEYEDLIRGAAEPPAEAMQPAMELANLYELANHMTLVQILEHIRKNRWGDLDDEWLSDPFEVGFLLAGMAINHPHNWPAASKLEPVHFEISFDGNTLVWSGDIAPKTNPAKYDEVLREAWSAIPPTTIVIERGNHGYSAWLESATGGRLPISLGLPRPTNAREALASAKRFLGRVHGRNNPAELTADTISDDQIEELWKTARHNSELYWLCVDALQSLDSVSMPARARLAEIINERARAAEAKLNPAGGPTRGGEVSRFRTTERGFGRTTAIIPRRREVSDDDAAQRIVDRDPALKRRAEQIAADRSRARQRPRRR